MEEKEIKEQVVELKDTLEKIVDKIDEKNVEIIGIQLILFEMATHMANRNINDFITEKMKTEIKENEESEEK